MVEARFFELPLSSLIPLSPSLFSAKLCSAGGTPKQFTGREKFLRYCLVRLVQEKHIMSGK